MLSPFNVVIQHSLYCRWRTCPPSYLLKVHWARLQILMRLELFCGSSFQSSDHGPTCYQCRWLFLPYLKGSSCMKICKFFSQYLATLTLQCQAPFLSSIKSQDSSFVFQLFRILWATDPIILNNVTLQSKHSKSSIVCDQETHSCLCPHAY